MFPLGVVDVCRRLPRSRLLHPVAVYSLVDEYGNYAPPDMDVIRLIRFALYYNRRGQVDRMERELDRSYAELHRARHGNSKERMMNAMSKWLSLWGDRQFQNRVYLRKHYRDGSVSRKVLPSGRPSSG